MLREYGLSLRDQNEMTQEQFNLLLIVASERMRRERESRDDDAPEKDDSVTLDQFMSLGIKEG